MRPFIRDAYQWQQQHTQFHITKSYTHCARAHFYLLPPDVLALFKCFVSKEFFMMVCACVIPHAAAGCRREKLKQTGCRRKERCWMLIALAGSRARNVQLGDQHVAPLEISFLALAPTDIVSRAHIVLCASFSTMCARVKSNAAHLKRD